MLHSLTLFARQALKNPRNIGALTPSGRALGRFMARGLGAQSGTVVEIGSGTGSLTRGLVSAGVPQENLVLVEMNEAFCAHLQAAYPRARIIHGPAQSLPDHDIGPVECVISGLPMLNFPTPLQIDILSAVFKSLQPSGQMVQFTYGLKPPLAPKAMEALNLDWHLRGRVLANVPPASVYEFTQRSA